MTETAEDFAAYCALDPVTRMQARLHGIAEVLSASGLRILPGGAPSEAAPQERFGVSFGHQQAFNETGAEYDAHRPVAEAPVDTGPRLSTFTLSKDELTALAKTLDVPRERLVAALNETAGR